MNKKKLLIQVSFKVNNGKKLIQLSFNPENDDEERLYNNIKNYKEIGMTRNGKIKKILLDWYFKNGILDKNNEDEEEVYNSIVGYKEIGISLNGRIKKILNEWYNEIGKDVEKEETETVVKEDKKIQINKDDLDIINQVNNL